MTTRLIRPRTSPGRTRPSTLTATAAALALPLALGLLPPAHAAAPSLPDEDRRASAASSDTTEPLTQVERLAGDRLTVTSSTTDVAPGVQRTSARFLDARGWLDVDLLTVDLADDGSDLELLTPGTVAETATLP